MFFVKIVCVSQKYFILFFIYGILNFSACQKIVQQRLSASTTCLTTPTNSRPSTPSNPLAPTRGMHPAPSPPLALPTPQSPSHAHTLSHKVKKVIYHYYFYLKYLVIVFSF